MPRTPLQFQQMKDERKLSILESALPLFATNGKDGVSIDMICQKAKCSHGLAYHYFKNSEQIYLELLSSNTYKNLFSKLDVFDFTKEAYSQLVELVRKFVDLSNESKTIISFALIILANDGKLSLYSKIIKLISQGQNEGTITGGSPSDITSTLLLFFKGLFLTKLNEKHPTIKVPSIDNIIKVFKR